MRQVLFLFLILLLPFLEMIGKIGHVGVKIFWWYWGSCWNRDHREYGVSEPSLLFPWLKLSKLNGDVLYAILKELVHHESSHCTKRCHLIKRVKKNGSDFVKLLLSFFGIFSEIWLKYDWPFSWWAEKNSFYICYGLVFYIC